MYLPDKVGALAAAKDALRPGGRYAAIVFSEADRNRFFSVPISIIRRNAELPAPGARRCPGRSPPRTSASCLEGAGFQDVEVHRVEAPLQLALGRRVHPARTGVVRRAAPDARGPRRARAGGDVGRDRGCAAASSRAAGEFSGPCELLVGAGDEARAIERRPGRAIAWSSRAPEGDQAARVQVVRRPGRDPARAGRRRRRRPERLRQVERLRLDPLGDRLDEPGRAARREARRRPLRRLGRPPAGRLLRGRPALRQRRRRVARPAVQRGLGRAPPAPRRRGPVPRQQDAGPPHRPGRAALRRRPRRRSALGHLAGPRRDGAQLEAGRAARADRGGRRARPLQAPPPSRRAEARACRASRSTARATSRTR